MLVHTSRSRLVNHAQNPLSIIHRLAPNLQCRRFTRPTFAPHPLPDIKHIAQNPALYEENCNSRNYPNLARIPQEIVKLRDASRRLIEVNKEKQTEYQQLQHGIRKQNTLIREAGSDDGSLSTTQEELEEAIRKVSGLKSELDEYENTLAANEDAIKEKALLLPNLSSVHTPEGKESQVLDVVQNISPKHLEPLGKSHVHIGQDLNIIHFDKSAVTSGWGWYFLSNDAALLEQALVQYALSELISRGWEMYSPPTMVYSHIADACGFQPRDQNDEQQIYRVQSPQRRSTSDSAPHVLAGTSEIPLAGMFANQTLHADSLPLKKVAVSRCYRAEAGARGADTKGLYRVHEFTKVEMFAWTAPPPNEKNFDTSQDGQQSQSEQIFDEMLDIQRHILNQLGFNFRILEMPAADLGASATRKKDIEVFFPSRRDRDNGWGEVTSASMCTDYQSRRLRTRLRNAGSNALSFPHTLNGTVVAIPRTIAALLECFWDERNQRVRVPDVLRPWMLGVDRDYIVNRSGR